MESKIKKLELSLVKRLLKDLESELEETYSLRESVPFDKAKYEDCIVSVSKSIGLLAGISQEASALIGDLKVFAQYSIPESKDNAFDVNSILSGFIKQSGGGGGKN